MTIKEYALVLEACAKERVSLVPALWSAPAAGPVSFLRETYPKQPWLGRKYLEHAFGEEGFFLKHYLPALENGDYSGLEESEVQVLKDWESRFELLSYEDLEPDNFATCAITGAWGDCVCATWIARKHLEEELQ